MMTVNEVSKLTGVSRFIQSGFYSLIYIWIDTALESDYNVSVSDTNTI